MRLSSLLHPSSRRRLVVVLLAVVFATTPSLAQSISYSPTWTQQSPATSPPARSYPTMAYDAATGQVVLFGGLGATAYLADTWTWDGTTWTQQSPATSPPARDNATMAYDAATGQVVLFGGSNNTGKLGDTWTWDGTTWTRQGVVNAGPSARIYSTMAYDAATGQVVLFGGYDNGGALRDTWTWDGTTWTQQSPATSPSSRYDSTMAYDAATGQVVLFGGAGTSSYLADTWTWNGTTWTLQNPATSPPARYASTTAYDPATRQVVLFGGAGTASSSFDDTWTWDGTTWTQQSPATSPSARNASTMAYDLATAQVVLFGGINPGVVLNDTWTLVLGPVNLGTANVCANGSTPAPCSQTSTVNFTVGASNVNVKNVNVLTQGAPNLDFTATATTCSGALNANTACTVTVKFAPRHPGQRLGGISLTDSSGNILGNIPLYGIGSGPQVIFPSNASSESLAGSFTEPNGVAVDGSGDVFVADSNDLAVQEIVAVNGVLSSSSTVKTVGRNFGYVYSVAVDGSGDIFVADNGSVKEIVAVNGVVSSTSTVNIVGSGFNRPYGVAVDGNGNVFVSDIASTSVKEIVAVNGVVSSTSTVNTVGSGFIGPLGVAVDGSGDVFVADTGKVKEVLAVNGVVDSSSTVITVGSGFNSPHSVAVDASGDVFVADTGNGVVKEILAVNGSVSSSSPVITVGSPLNTPRGVAVDGSGNIFASGNVSTVAEFPLATPPTVTFATATTDGMTDSTDGTQTVTVQNDGNQPLVFVVPTKGLNPSVSTGYTLGTGSSANCPSLSSNSAATAVAAGATCTLPIGFAPVPGTPTGTVSGQVVLLDNALNVNGAMQTVSLSGSAVEVSAKSLTITGTPQTAYAGAPFNLTVNALDGNGNITPSYTGTVSFSSSDGAATLPGSYQFTPADAGTHTFPVTLVTAGNQTITATDAVTPLSAKSGNILVNIPGLVVTTAVDDPSPVDQCGSAPTNGPTACRAAAVMKEVENCPVSNSPASTSCSLRDALQVASMLGSATITFDPTVFATAQTISIAGHSSLGLSGAVYVTINGPTDVSGKSLVTIDGGYDHTSNSGGVRVFSLTGTGSTTLNHLIVQNGNDGTSGGGIYADGGTVILNNSTLSGNVASGAGQGGGLYVNSGTVTIGNSTFSGNAAGNSGGGLYQASGSLTASNSTFSGNSASSGGAISAYSSLTVSNSTFSGNSSRTSGGAIFATSTLTVSNSIFSGDTATGGGSGINALGGGTVDHIVYNGDAFSGVMPTASINADPKLSPLGNYGGPTPTLLPLPGSAAICAGTQPSLNSVPLTSDQRGVTISPRRYGQTACYDIGAVQTGYALAFTTSPGDTQVTRSLAPTPVVTLYENGTALTAGSANLVMSAAAGTLYGTRTRSTSTTAGPTAGQASFTGLSFNGIETADALTATLALTSSINLTAQSSSFNVTAIPVSTGNSTLMVSPSPAVAGSPVTVTAMVLDASHDPIVGATVDFSQTTTGGAASTTAAFNSTRTVTNASGVASVTLTDTAAESLTLSATVTGIGSGSLSTSVTFLPAAYVVTVATDPTSANENASHCVAAGLTGSNANCSLREAVDAANALTGVTANISFSGAAVGTAGSPAVILIAQQGGITISQNVNLNGPGANLLTLEGGIAPYNGTTQTSNNRILQIGGGANVSISGLTFANAYTGSNANGAAIRTAGIGTLSVSNSTFSGNSAGNVGGAILAESMLTVTSSTFSGNSANNDGGAIYATSPLTVSNSTFSGNSASNDGGAIYANSPLTVSNSTFSGNSANYGGEIFVSSAGTLTVSNSIFSGGSAAAGSGIFSYGGTVDHVVYYSESFSNNSLTNVINLDPKLSPLGNYGGPTPTLLPLPGSAAICAGTQPSLNGAPLPTDQRGVAISPARYGQTACYDVGAVQTQYALTGPLTVPTLVPLGSAVSPAPTVSLTESGTPLTAAAATVTLTDTQNDISTGASSTNSQTTGVVTFGGLQFSTAETTDQLTATLSLNPATPVSLTVMSNSFQVGQLTPVFTFSPSPSSQTYGTAIAVGSLDATASYGGNAVAGSFAYTATSNTNNQSTALTSSVTILAADTYTLTATFTPTNPTLYKSGLTVQAGYTVGKASQAISFTTAPPASATYNTQFTVVATGGGSGNALGYASAGGCTNVGATYTMTSGTTACTVTVSQAGNTNYTAATNSVSTVTANLANSTLSFAAIPQHTYGDVPFNVSATSASTGSVSYGLVGGAATVGSTSGLVTLSGAGTVKLSASQQATSNYAQATANTQFTVLQQASMTTLGLSSSSITPLQTVTLTATVAPTVAGSVTPIGSVTFFDASTVPATQLGGSINLVNGQAQLAGLSLVSGPHILYANYSSDANYLGSSSSVAASNITVAAEDFTFTAAGYATQSVVPGTAGTFTFQLAPLYDKYPGPVVFSVTGLPPGATYTVTPTTIATNAGPQTVTVTINTPQAIVMRTVGRSSPWALALLLPVFLLRRTRRKLGHAVALALLLSAGAFALSGCGANSNGYFGQSVKNYTVTVTGTSGAVTHSSTITLQVQ